MDTPLANAARVVLLVDAPETFAERVRSALPECRIVACGVPAPASLSRYDLVILYSAGALDRQVLATLAACVRTVVVSEISDAEEPLAALDAGADGYLSAAIAPEALRSGLMGVLENEVAYGREALGRWLRTRQRDGRSRAALSDRQREILALIASGATDKEIAGAFGLRTTTVQKQVARLLRRMGARNRAAAVAAGRRLGTGVGTRH